MTARATLEASAAAFYGGVELGARNLVSGRHAPTDDLPGWQLAFVDDFNVDVPLGSFPSALASTWDAYPTSYTDTSGQGTYNPAKTISCAASKMLIHTWWEGGQPKPWVAAPRPIVVPGSPLPYTHSYGRMSVRWRLKSQTGDGFKIAWLTWPASNRHVGPITWTGTLTSGSTTVAVAQWVGSYPPFVGQAVSGVGIQPGTTIAAYAGASATTMTLSLPATANGSQTLTLSGGDGELDYPEITDFTTSGGTAVELHAFVHHQGGVTSNVDQTHIETVFDVNQWHTTTIEWSEGLVVVRLDDVEIGRVTEADVVASHGAAQGVPNTPMSWRFQTETAIGRTTISTDEMTLELDWVGIWLPA